MAFTCTCSLYLIHLRSARDLLRNGYLILSGSYLNAVNHTIADNYRSLSCRSVESDSDPWAPDDTFGRRVVLPWLARPSMETRCAYWQPSHVLPSCRQLCVTGACVQP
jgi:hypothetical protein